LTPDLQNAGDAAAPPAPDHWPELPLFPLQTVLFPGGLLPLKIFEARYLDLVSHCLRNRSPFGVVCIGQGSEVRGGGGGGGGGGGATGGGAGEKLRLEPIAVLAHLQDVDAEQTGILTIRCIGGRRVQLGTPWQRPDGLWLATAQALDDDVPATVPPEFDATARALGQAIGSLAAQDQRPFDRPYRLDEAGWVANRWCEVLPISVAAKYRLMVLDEPVLRLKLVDEYLRGKGVV
jgi:Lon protease-like protein